MCIRDRGDTKRIKKGTVQSIIIMLIMAACSILIGLLLTIDGTYPVSYTHLDVYKRQAGSASQM